MKWVRNIIFAVITVSIFIMNLARAGANDVYIGPARQPITEADRALALARWETKRFSVKEALRHPGQSFQQLSKEEKVAALNAAGLAFLAIVGLTSWEYGSSLFHTRGEGWFGEDTRYGGADKLGHFWSTYALSEVFGDLFEKWGFDKPKAYVLSSVSSWFLMLMTEFGDSFSKDHGFSKEDLTMNTLGALTSYFTQRFPEFDAKVDMRVQYDFNERPEDLFTDYENLKYILAIKAEGFRRFQDGPMSWLEFHLGYYTRDYRTERFDEKSRNLYAGIYVNFTRILRRNGKPGLARTFEFVQPSYTSFDQLKKDLNDD